MADRKRRIKPCARCVRCGELITAEDTTDVHRKYTQHVVREHDKPSQAQRSDRPPAPIQDHE